MVSGPATSSDSQPQDSPVLQSPVLFSSVESPQSQDAFVGSSSLEVPRVPEHPPVCRLRHVIKVKFPSKELPCLELSSLSASAQCRIDVPGDGNAVPRFDFGRHTKGVLFDRYCVEEYRNFFYRDSGELRPAAWYPEGSTQKLPPCDHLEFPSPS